MLRARDQWPCRWVTPVNRPALAKQWLQLRCDCDGPAQQQTQASGVGVDQRSNLGAWRLLAARCVVTTRGCHSPVQQVNERAAPLSTASLAPPSSPRPPSPGHLADWTGLRWAKKKRGRMAAKGTRGQPSLVAFAFLSSLLFSFAARSSSPPQPAERIKSDGHTEGRRRRKRGQREI